MTGKGLPAKGSGGDRLVAAGGEAVYGTLLN
jgi:hypothetical protein